MLVDVFESTFLEDLFHFYVEDLDFFIEVAEAVEEVCFDSAEAEALSLKEKDFLDDDCKVFCQEG